MDRSTEGLVALSDIADLAGVSRAAVSKWRKQRDGFPQECGGTISRPLFKRVEVEDWLRDNGYSAEVERGAAPLRVLASINRFGTDMDAAGIRMFVLSILCARKLADGTRKLERLQKAATAGCLLDALVEVGRESPPDSQWRSLVSAGLTSVDTLRTRSSIGHIDLESLGMEVFGATDPNSVAEVSDLVLERWGSSDGRPPGAHGAVDSRVAQLLADVSAHATGVVYDPACGIGETLMTIWKQSAHRDSLKLIGHEVDEEYVLTCRQRFFLNDVEADIVQADVLMNDSDPTLRADLVIAEPPLSGKMPEYFSVTDPRWTLAGLPPRNNSETAWLQHVIAHLKPDERARGIVVTSAATTSAPDSAEIRSALVRQGCVDAVVALPRRFLAYTSVSTAVWLLLPRGNPPSSHNVYFIDASGIPPEECTEETFAEWRSQTAAIPSVGIRSRKVPIGEVISDDRISLDPRYWSQHSGDSSEYEKRCEVAISTIGTELANLKIPVNLTVNVIAPADHSVTLRALERQGIAQIMRSRSVDRRDGTADRDEPVVTEPGDILIAKRPQISVTVEETGGKPLEFGVTIVRLDKERFLPEYAAECIAARWNRRTEAGVEIFVAGIRDLVIPAIDIREQARVVAEVGRFRGLSESARRIASAADELAAAQIESIKFRSNIT